MTFYDAHKYVPSEPFDSCTYDDNSLLCIEKALIGEHSCDVGASPNTVHTPYNIPDGCSSTSCEDLDNHKYEKCTLDIH